MLSLSIHQKKLVPLHIALLFAQGLTGKYHSQVAQDKWVNENIFENSKNCTFVDVGAANGIEISNTLFFEQELAWDGVCIEAIPEKYNQLKNNRKCYCEHACIGVEKKEVQFVVVTSHPGPIKHGNDSKLLSGRLDTWEKERIKILNTAKKEIITLTTTPMREILDKYNVDCIDYLSIDVEGAELEVLKSIDWDRISIGVIDVENNYGKNNTTRQFLKHKGYIMVKRIRTDDIWVDPEYIYKLFPQSPVARALKEKS